MDTTVCDDNVLSDGRLYLEGFSLPVYIGAERNLLIGQLDLLNRVIRDPVNAHKLAWPVIP